MILSKTMVLLLLFLVFAAVTCQAALLYPEVPITSAVTNIHSPTAISHQSITQIHTKDQQVIVKPLDYVLAKQPLHAYHKESTSLDKLILSSTDTSAETQALVFPPVIDHVKSTEFETSSYNISYKDNIPVFTSQTHTPAHLTYAAQPIVYKMLPKFKTSVLNKNYEDFLSSPKDKIYY